MMVICATCGAGNPAHMTHCAKCGNALISNVCPNCATDNPTQFKYCGNCGIRLNDPVTRGAEAADRAPEPERRQLTVLFCDMKDSLRWSRRLDPEQYRLLLKRYRETCVPIIRHYGQHQARLIGDGIRVYFGYPEAHEDDAERAVRAGLDILAAVTATNAANGWSGEIKLEVRIGIATGPVVAGEMLGQSRNGGTETEAVGEAPNLAARIQSIAPPNTVMIAPATKKLLGDLFDYSSHGPQQIKGIPEPVEVWQVSDTKWPESRFDAMRSPHTPLVAREVEIEFLRERWQRASRGEGQVVVLVGAAGIGKSRIARVLRAGISNPHHRLHYQCSNYHQKSAFYPILSQFERTAGFVSGDSAAVKLARIRNILAPGDDTEAEVVPLVASMLSIPAAGLYQQPEMDPQRQKEKTLLALVEQTRRLAAERPTLAIFEDVHWIDPSSLELLDQIVAASRDMALMLVVTMRPGELPAWVGESQVSLVELDSLTNVQGEALVRAIVGDKRIPAKVVAQIVDKGEGIPLYIEELTKTVLESMHRTIATDQTTNNGRWPAVTVPATLQDSLMARLDQLAPAKAIAQVAAVIGRSFRFTLLAAVTSTPDEQLQSGLDALVRSDLLVQRQAPPAESYEFRHVLLQQAAADSLLGSRRRALHAQIAGALDELFPWERETQPELLAYHYSEAGMIEKAVDFWLLAGQRAVERSANEEAISHLRHGIDGLSSIDSITARQDQELALRIALGPALICMQGPGTRPVEQNYARALELCKQLPESPLHFAAYWGWWRSSENFAVMRSRAAELQAQAESLKEPGLRLQAHHSQWATLFSVGDQHACVAHTRAGLALYDRAEHHAHAAIYGGHDPAVCAHVNGGWALWLLGYPDQALVSVDRAARLADRTKHSASQAFSLYAQLMLHHFLRDVSAVSAVANEIITLADQRDLAEYRAKGQVFRGWSIAHDGAREQGLEAILSGIDNLRAIGAAEDTPVFLDMAAEIHGLLDQPRQGLARIDAALQEVEQSGMLFWTPELYRRRGELFELQNEVEPERIDDCFQQAMTIAEQQHVRSLQLRIAISMVTAQRDRGVATAAATRLRSVFEGFSEGFATHDLIVARNLLDEVSG